MLMRSCERLRHEPISVLLAIRKLDVYDACDGGLLRYVKFEGAL